MPRMSIIVPVYNVERYINECVGSVLSQDKVDFELILVDDGSTDGSGHICDRFAASDSRVKVIHQQNGGHIKARMRGIRAATGEYVLFADSDDYWLPGAFAAIDSALAEHGCDVLIYNYADNGKPNGQNFFSEEKDEILLSDYLLANLRYSGINALYAKAISRRLFDSVDITPFAGFRNSEDMLLSIEIIKRAEKVSYVPRAFYFHRMDNPDSIANNYRPVAFDEFVASRSKLMEELEAIGCADENAKNEFCRAFLFYAANTALQVSMAGQLSRKERISHYEHITAVPLFASAAEKLDCSNLSRAKALRIRLLKSKKFTALYLIDKLRSFF